MADELRQRTLVAGLYAGLAGYVTTVVVLAAVNFLAGRSPLHTAALFGSALFYDLRDPAALQVSAGPVLAYNMVHLLAFLGLGLVASWLATESERYPALRYFALVAFIFIASHFYLAGWMFAYPLLGAAAGWELGVSGLLAALAMGWTLLAIHPKLRRGLKDIPIGSEEEAEE